MRPPSDSFQEQAGGELAIQPVGIPQFRFQGGFFLFQILQARLSSAEAQHGSLLGVARQRASVLKRITLAGDEPAV